MRAFAQTFLRDESGATAIEYALMAAMIALVLITSISTLGNNMKSSLYNNIAAGVK